MPTEYEIVTPVKKGCRFCGSKTVAWFQSDNERWYLAEAFEIDGETRASRKDFHSKYCVKRIGGEKHNPRLDHDEEQRKLSQREDDDANERMELRAKVERDAEEKSADRFLTLMSMDADLQRATVIELELKIRAHHRNPPTMDYMTEFNRAIADCKQWQTEWRFLKALMGDPQDENFKPNIL